MRAAWRWLTQDWTLKLAGIGVALLLWAVVKSEDVVTFNAGRVPIEVSIRDPAWELAVRAPTKTSVVVTGPVREVLHLLVDRPRLVVPVEDVADSVQVLVLRTSWVQLPEDVQRTRVEDLRPGTVRLVFDPKAARELPVWLPVRGRLPEGVAFTGPVLFDPEYVRVSGARRRVARLDSVSLPAVDLGHLTDTTVMRMDIDTAALGLQVRPSSVRVRIAVARGGTALPLPVDTARADTLHPLPRDSGRDMLGATLSHAAAPASAREPGPPGPRPAPAHAPITTAPAHAPATTAPTRAPAVTPARSTEPEPR